MPSARYTRNIKPEDILPDEPKQLSKKERRANWWHYNKKWVLLGVLAVVLVGFGVKDLLDQVEPDYKLIYISSRSLPDEATSKLCDEVAKFGEDLNGDGDVVVRLVSCQINFIDEFNEDADYDDVTDTVNQANDAYVQMAGVTFLSTEIDSRESLIVITDAPEVVQENYNILQMDTFRAWGECPVLTSIEFDSYTDLGGQTHEVAPLFENLYIGCRSFWDDKPMKEYAQQNEALFAALTAGSTAS